MAEISKKSKERIKVCCGDDTRAIDIDMPPSMGRIRDALEEEYGHSNLQLWFRPLPLWRLNIHVGGARHLPTPEHIGPCNAFCDVHIPAPDSRYDGPLASPQVLRTGVADGTNAPDWNQDLSIVIDGSAGPPRGGGGGGGGRAPELHLRVMDCEYAHGQPPRVRPLGHVVVDIAALGAFLALEQARGPIHCRRSARTPAPGARRRTGTGRDSAPPSAPGGKRRATRGRSERPRASSSRPAPVMPGACPL